MGLHFLHQAYSLCPVVNLEPAWVVPVFPTIRGVPRRVTCAEP